MQQDLNEEPADPLEVIFNPAQGDEQEEVHHIEHP